MLNKICCIINFKKVWNKYVAQVFMLYYLEGINLTINFWKYYEKSYTFIVFSKINHQVDSF